MFGYYDSKLGHFMCMKCIDVVYLKVYNSVNLQGIRLVTSAKEDM